MVERMPEKVKEGFFVRDFESGTVICPAGYVLYKKCVKKNGYTRYMRKAACSRCDQFKRCYSGKMKWKEIDFPEGAACVSCKNWFSSQGGSKQPRGHPEKRAE